MLLNPTQSWTVSFFRGWLPYVSLRSVLRVRDSVPAVREEKAA